MSSLERLARALETLKTSDSPAATDGSSAGPPSLRASLVDLKPAILFRPREAPLTSRDKKQCCAHLADGMVSTMVRGSADLLQRYLPAVVETLLQLADDSDADVRTAAHESLNRIVRGLSENNMGRLLVELYRCIRLNNNWRVVATALGRFAELATRIRPQKRRAYVVNLFPCVVRLSQRPEPALQHSLAAALVTMAPVLGIFFTDGEVKVVLRSFLSNLESSVPTLRRAASQVIVALSSHCRKPELFLPWLLATLVDWLVPVRADTECGRVLGVLLCLRDLVPLLDELCDTLSSERLLQLFELLLHHTQHDNHNVVTSALDALNQLLRAPPAELLAALLTEGAIERSRIQAGLQTAAGTEPSVLSVAPSLAGDEVELAETESLVWPSDEVVPAEPASESPLPTDDADTDEPTLRVSTPPVDDVIDPLRYDVSPATEESPTSPDGHQGPAMWAGDVGSLMDGGVALVHCCRVVASRYLLTGHPGGLRPDKDARVSIKVLSVNCISAAVSLMPGVLRLPVLVSAHPESVDCQYLWDVLAFAADPDPQLRGAAALLSAAYLRATALHESDGQPLSSVPSQLEPQALTDTLQKVLLDGNHVASRQALEGMTQCLEPLLKSVSYDLLLPLLAGLLRVTANSYWLVKVNLCALVAVLPLPELELLWRWGSADDSSYHQLLLDNVLLRLLEDADHRVQQAASAAIVSYVERVPVGADADEWTVEVAVGQRTGLLRPPQPWGTGLRLVGAAGPRVTGNLRPADLPPATALSTVVSTLVNLLMMTDSKHVVSGGLLALRALMDKHPATAYPEAWQVNQKRCRRGLYQLCVSMVTSTHLMHDLATHANLVYLSARLAAGICVYQHRARPSQEREERQRANWDLLEPLMLHLLRVLNIYTHLAGEMPPSTPQTKSTLPSFPSASSLSPIKKKSAASDRAWATGSPSPSPVPASDDKAASVDREEKETEKKAKQAAGFFMSSSEYHKLYSILKSIYETYKITLNAQSSSKLLCVLDACLAALSVLLQLLGTAQVAPLAEELLHYASVLISLSPASALHCVLQMLRAMFSSAAAGWESGGTPPTPATSSVSHQEEAGLYQACVNGPYVEFATFVTNTRRLTAAPTSHSDPAPRPEYAVRRAGQTPPHGTDKQALASYIRVFEPCVIKALKLYTVTSDPEVQNQVLWLLIQLVQLRVNYCLLDSDQIFIGYVIKQLEHVEEGQTKEGSAVIPAIFRFLVELSYERYHSKTVISIPKVIQLCDGLVASGQPPQVYALPALRPIVEDLFVSPRPSAQNIKELETQKEVLLTMLLRLVQYPEVLELVSLAVCESRLGGEESWRLTSRAVLDALLPPLLQLHVRLDSAASLDTLHRLLAALCPRAIRPADDLLAALLRQPVGVSSVSDMQRWGGMLCALLRLLVTHVREEVLLASVEDFGLATIELCGDQQRAVNAKEIVVRFLLSSVELLAGQLASVAASPLMSGTTTFLPQLLAQLLQIVIYIVQSGSFGECARCAMRLVSQGLYDLTAIGESFVTLATVQPLLTLSWCNLLALLNHCRLTFWRSLTQPPRHPSLDTSGSKALHLVRRGALILLCDYVCENTSDGELLAWLLTSHITELVSLSGEPPVADMMAALHRNPSASGLLIQAVAARCHLLHQPLMAQRVLRCLEGAPSGQYGPLLLLLSRTLLASHHLAVADEVARLLCRKLEIMLAAESRILSEDNFTELVETISKEPTLQGRTELVALVTRLGQTFFGVNLHLGEDKGPRSTADPPATPERAWFVDLVRDTSSWPSAPGRQCAKMLCRLPPEEILDVLMADSTDPTVLQHCFHVDHTADGTSVLTLYGAAETALCRHLERLCDLLPSPDQAFASDRYRKYQRRLEERLSEPAVWRQLVQLSGAVHAYCAGRHQELPAEVAPLLARLALLALEALRYSVASRLPELPRHVRLFLNTASGCLHFPTVLTSLSKRDNQWTILAVNAIYRVTRALRGALPDAAVSAVSSGVDCRVYQRMASLVLWAESPQDRHQTATLIRSVVLAVGRLPLLASFLRVPPDMYRLGWNEEEQQQEGRFSPVAVRYLQEADVLKQYTLRVNMLGWTGRREFEETWMTYLSVLNAATEDDTSNREELAVLLQTNCLAVRGITSLLLQTLTSMTPGYPDSSSTLHHPRHKPAPLVPGSAIAHLQHTLRQLEVEVEASPLLPSITLARQLNLERRQDWARYGHGQLSLRYLQAVLSGSDAGQGGREVALADSGLDINSCMVFLLQLYAQWTVPGVGVPLPLLTETVRSTVLLSDLLTERAQWQWLLTMCVTLYQLHPIDDEIMLQYLVLGLCKAAAVLQAEDGTVVETVRRAVEHGLRCSLPPVRISTVHGCLLLLQLGPGELSNSVLPALVDFVQRSIHHIATVPGYNDDYDLAVWAAAVYVLQHYDDGLSESEFSSVVLQHALSLASATRSSALYEALIKGMERLVVCGVVSITAAPMQLALEQLQQRSAHRQLHALSLLTTCLLAEPESQPSPETFIHVLETYSHVFTKMKAAPGFLSAVLCGTVTSGLLRLCPPSEVMNRVIGEFISPHQSHVGALADTVFQVFEACLAQKQEPLLQDWVLFSLPNFATSRADGRATWLLTCFLAGASRRPWLRAALPLLQRCGQGDLSGGCATLVELFLVAASDFYSQLSECQQRQFIAAIETPASGGNHTYKQLLLSLRDGTTRTTSG